MRDARHAAERREELSIRAALGAQPLSVVWAPLSSRPDTRDDRHRHRSPGRSDRVAERRPELPKESRAKRSGFRQFTASQLPVKIERFPDDPNGIGHAEQILYDDLFVLENLVVFEESPNLPQHMRR